MINFLGGLIGDLNQLYSPHECSAEYSAEHSADSGRDLRDQTYEEDPVWAERRQRFFQVIDEMGVEDATGVELLRLIKMTANAYDALTTERMKHENLSGPRWRILLQLFIMEKHDTPSLSPTELSQTQRLSKNTISAHLRSLEEQKLIVREVDPTDLRQFRIQLSDQGREIIRESTPGHLNFYNELAASLSAEERTTLLSLLNRLHHSLCRQSTSKLSTEPK